MYSARSTTRAGASSEGQAQAAAAARTRPSPASQARASRSAPTAARGVTASTAATAAAARPQASRVRAAAPACLHLQEHLLQVHRVEPLDHGRAQALVAVAQRLALQGPQAPGQPAPLAGGRAGVGQRRCRPRPGRSPGPAGRTGPPPRARRPAGSGRRSGPWPAGSAAAGAGSFQAAVANTWVSIRVSSGRYRPAWPAGLEPLHEPAEADQAHPVPLAQVGRGQRGGRADGLVQGAAGRPRTSRSCPGTGPRRWPVRGGAG